MSVCGCVGVGVCLTWTSGDSSRISPMYSGCLGECECVVGEEGWVCGGVEGTE